MSRPNLLWLFLLCLMVGGCGYHFAGRGTALPEGVEVVEILPVQNRTTRPRVHIEFADRLVDEVVRQGALRLASAQRPADAQLQTTVANYASSALAYDSQDNITEYRARMRVSAELRLVDSGKILWKGDVERFEEYVSSDDRSVQRDREEEAIRTLCERLARDLYSRITDNF